MGYYKCSGFSHYYFLLIKYFAMRIRYFIKEKINTHLKMKEAPLFMLNTPPPP